MLQTDETGSSKARRLDSAIQGLKEKYIDCKVCPPERSCCVFSGRYAGVFAKESLQKIVGGDKFTQMLEEGNLVPMERIPGTYFMVRTRCPALASDYICEVHDKKEELGLEGCISFPIYYSEGQWFSNLGEMVESVLADYRCHSVEVNWPALTDELTGLRKEFGIMVGVRYQTNGNLKIDTLSSFESAKKNNRIPPQMLYQSES